MHPPLFPHLHTPKCQELIKQLERCHKENNWGKFLGACNDLKRALDRCLTEEYLEKRRANQELADRKKTLCRKLYEE